MKANEVQLGVHAIINSAGLAIHSELQYIPTGINNESSVRALPEL